MEKKTKVSSTSSSNIRFYNIQELENPNFIRYFYFSNYTLPIEAAQEQNKPKGLFKLELPFLKINENLRLTILVFVFVLAFLTIKRMF